MSKVLHMPLTDLSDWVGSCTSSPQKGVKYQLWYLDLGCLNISDDKLPKDGNVLSHLGFELKVWHGSLTDLSNCVGFCTSSPHQGVTYQLDIRILGDPINIQWKITEERQSYIPLEAYVKGIACVFNWLKCLGGIMHLTPTAGFQNKNCGGGSL